MDILNVLNDSLNNQLLKTDCNAKDLNNLLLTLERKRLLPEGMGFLTQKMFENGIRHSQSEWRYHRIGSFILVSSLNDAEHGELYLAGLSVGTELNLRLSSGDLGYIRYDPGLDQLLLSSVSFPTNHPPEYIDRVKKETAQLAELITGITTEVIEGQ